MTPLAIAPATLFTSACCSALPPLDVKGVAFPAAAPRDEKDVAVERGAEAGR